LTNSVQKKYVSIVDTYFLNYSYISRYLESYKKLDVIKTFGVRNKSFSDNDELSKLIKKLNGSGNLKSVNEVISNIKSGPYNKDTPFVSGFIQCINPSCQSVYITCFQLGCTNLGCRGERDAIRRVCINLPYSYIINDSFIDAADFTDVSRTCLNTLEFQLVDAYGNVIDLKGPNISFSIIFKTSYS
jgi:hypothetical protein